MTMAYRDLHASSDWRALDGIASSILTKALIHRSAARLLEVVKWTLRNARSRRQLAALDDHILKDIGVTRDQALRESERAAWQGDWQRRSF